MRMARSRSDEGLGDGHCARTESASSPVPRPLTSHALPSTDSELLRETCECTIAVTKAPKGYTCHVSVTATVPADPRTVWAFLVHPDNALIFRQIERSTFRRVLARGADDSDGASGTGRRLVRVDDLYAWRFGTLGGTFMTRLLKDQDHSALVLMFEALPGSGGLSRLRGEWRLRPAGASQPGWTIVSLEQDLALGMWMPPLVRRAVKRVAAAQTRRIIEDMQEEAIRVAEGRPTLCPYETVHDKEIGERPEGGGAKAAERAQTKRLSGGGSSDFVNLRTVICSSLQL